MSQISQPSEPGTAPARNAGMSPALTTDDFPIPDGPTTVTSRSPQIASTSSATV